MIQAGGQAAETSPAASVPYIGRFAPSPTGPLHFGSLVAAMASYADARFATGRWLLRIEDLDAPRDSPQAAASFPTTLERYGFEWDGSILYQSTRHEAYADALAMLIREHRAFPCACTRSELSTAPIGHGGERIYPGTCRLGLPAGRGGRAWRARVDATTISFEDRIQGTISQQLDRDAGDFVVRRADGLWAYQLAVVVDDRDQHVTDIVRGADLLHSTPRQIWLQRQLADAPTARYAHVPLVVNACGEKLSKQTLAAALPMDAPERRLIEAWRFLGQREPDFIIGNVREFWTFATTVWDIARVPRGAQVSPDCAGQSARVDPL